MPITIQTDFTKIIGKIKPMHAVGQPPYPYMDASHLHYLTEAHIPYSRLHDMGGWFGGNMYVDVPNIFRDEDADPNLESSYDFACTDVLIKDMYEAGVKPIYRLGSTIENFAAVKSYRIYPPKDYDKWASVCEHIVRHYNEGWNNGFHYGIEYWEIWNEPEDGPNNQTWYGSDYDYFELYDVTAKKLKAAFGDSIKVGGYASCNMIGLLDTPEKYGLVGEKPRDSTYRIYFTKYAEKFFTYINEHNAPIDFFSWHSYASLEENVLISKALQSFLKQYGHEGLETQLNEWNNAWQREYRGTSYAAAQAAAFILAMQNCPTDMMCYYDARMDVSCFGGMFNPLDCKPLPLYYGFKAFGELYALGQQAQCTFDNNDNTLFAVAATDGAGRNALMIANIGESVCVDTGFTDGNMVAYLIDAEHPMTKLGAVNRHVQIGQNQTLLLTNTEF